MKRLELDKFKKSNCTCAECVSYCRKTPGWFRPSEIELLARFLHLSVKQLFKQFLIADYWIAEASDIYVLAPIKKFERAKDQLAVRSLLKDNELLNVKRDLPGHRASWSYAFVSAPCIFLKDDGCSIYPVRPFECAVAIHNSPRHLGNLREPISKEWRSNSLIETLFDGSEE